MPTQVIQNETPTQNQDKPGVVIRSEDFQMNQHGEYVFVTGSVGGPAFWAKFYPDSKGPRLFAKVIKTGESYQAPTLEQWASIKDALAPRYNALGKF